MEKKIVANNDNIKKIVNSEIERLGNKADLNHIDVSGVTNMEFLFDESSFNGDISNWNVGKVKEMRFMFQYSKFNQDISRWDVGNVRNMYGMFSNSKFNQDIDMWNYNFKSAEEEPIRFDLNSNTKHTLIEKYVKALKSEKFDLAEKIKFKMKGIRFNYRYKDVNESKHLVTIENNILKEFKEYLWKRK